MKKLFGKKWILHIALALCLVLAFVPVITHYASAGTAVASVTIGDTTTEYDSLDAAVQAVANCTVEDKAVLKLLQSFDMGFSTQEISSGVFTFDLNGQVLSSDWPTISVNGANVDFMDSRTGGTLKNSSSAALYIYGSTVTINSGTFLGKGDGSVSAYGSTVIVNGGTIGDNNGSGGLCVTGDCEVTVNGGVFCGYRQGLFAYNNNTVIINDGVFNGKEYGLWVIGGSKLTIEDGIFSSEKGIGAGVHLSTSETGSCVAEINGGVFNGGNCGLSIHGDEATINGGTYSGECGISLGNGTFVNGTVQGSVYGMRVSGNCTIAGGTISGGYCGVDGGGPLNITGGTISGKDLGLYYSTSYSYLTISGGTISSENIGMETYYCNSIDINGGTISGKTYGWFISDHAPTDWSVYRLNVKDNGIGATFVGGIDGHNTALATVLGEGAAYWQNGEKITLTEGQKVITGDVVIMSANAHKHSGTDYTNNGEDHTFTCTVCSKEITEAHSYDETTLLCPCGAVSAEAVALVSKNGIPTSAYITLKDAVKAVSAATAEDQAVLMLLQNIDLGENYQYIGAGVFSIDLNGKCLTSISVLSVLDVSGKNTHVTITDSGEGGTINGYAFGVFVSSNADITIDGGIIKGDAANGVGIWVAGGSLTVRGGVVTGGLGVIVHDESIANIEGGTIIGEEVGLYLNESSGEVIVNGGSIKATSIGLYLNKSTLTISGGTIDAPVDIEAYNDSAITLTRGEKGVGATFVDGISVSGATLEEILGEYAIYWQCGKMVVLTEGQTEITGCDVTVMDINTVVGIKGDLDGDGDVDAEDLTILARYVAGIITDWEEDED